MSTKPRSLAVRRGLTLIEMVVVMGIIVLLTTMILPVTISIAERDQVPKAGNAVQQGLARAKTLAMREAATGRAYGIRLLPRINQGEIPVPIQWIYNPMLPAPADALVDTDGDGEITFKDLNYVELNPNSLNYGNYINIGSGKIRDVNGNGPIDPADVMAPKGPEGPGHAPARNANDVPANGAAVHNAPNEGGWSDDKDGTALNGQMDNNVRDDIVTNVDQLEYIHEPEPMRDGWVWTYTAPGETTVPNLDPLPGEPLDIEPDPEQLGVENAPRPPTTGNPDLDKALNQAIPAPKATTVYGPFAMDWRAMPASKGKLVPKLQRAAQRPGFDFIGAVERGDLLKVTLAAGPTILRVTDVRPAGTSGGVLSDVEPTIPDISGGGLPDGLPSGDLPPPMGLNWRYSFPAPLVTVALQGNNLVIQLNAKPSRLIVNVGGLTIPAPANNKALNPPSNYQIIRRPRPLPAERPLTLPANVGIDMRPRNLEDPKKDGLTTKGTSDILFSAAGQVLNTKEDIIFLHLRDKRAGFEDNEGLVAVFTRTGKVGTYPVNRDGGDPYSYARHGTGEGGL